jgi:hypothetical protein
MARLGGFGYFGRTQDNADTRLKNDTYYLGADLVVDVGAKSQLNAQFLYREDDDPFYVGGEKYCTRGGFLEAHYFPQGQDGRWALSCLYNRVASDDDAADRETVSLTANHLLDRNLRLMLEGGRDVEAGKTRLSVGLISAF